MIVNDTVYGQIEFDDFLERIIATAPMQRLINIHQGGAMFLAYPNIKTSRFEHSLGVCHLIEVIGGNKREQIAGLLHDLSHTAFSHVIDYVLDNKEEDFHEKHKLRFLCQEELSGALHSLGLKPNDFLEDKHFSLLEAEHPFLCADRIDYTLRDLIAWGKISQQEARQFIESLILIKEKIVVKSVFWGQWFKDNYEYLNRYIFQDYKNIVANSLLFQLLKKALLMNVIQLEDFFEDDKHIIGKITDCSSLKTSFDLIVLRLKIANSQSNNISFKKRFVDPLVLENKRVAKLSDFVDQS